MSTESNEGKSDKTRSGPASGYATDFVRSLSSALDSHGDACVCERCKNGVEVFILTSDIERLRDEIIEECARAVETQVRGTSYQWLGESLFARLVAKSAQRVRSLKSHNEVAERRAQQKGNNDE